MFDEDQTNNEGANVSVTFFQRLIESNTKINTGINSRIWPNFELGQGVMHFQLVTCICKFNVDRSKMKALSGPQHFCIIYKWDKARAQW